MPTASYKRQWTLIIFPMARKLNKPRWAEYGHYKSCRAANRFAKTLRNYRYMVVPRKTHKVQLMMLNG